MATGEVLAVAKDPAVRYQRGAVGAPVEKGAKVRKRAVGRRQRAIGQRVVDAVRGNVQIWVDVHR